MECTIKCLIVYGAAIHCRWLSLNQFATVHQYAFKQSRTGYAINVTVLAHFLCAWTDSRQKPLIKVGLSSTSLCDYHTLP